MRWSGLGRGLSRRARGLLIPSSSFVSLAQVHFFNSFFYDKLRTKGYDGVKRWTKNVRHSVKLGKSSVFMWRE
uniref:Ubiquitin-like protease family profile domain-containing protein n=1 Tax=Sus scrofa TaxID=9823 RepID=A0A8D0XBV5_PIG